MVTTSDGKVPQSTLFRNQKETFLGYSLVYIAKALKAPKEIIEVCAVVNPEYAVSRYPNAAAAIPFEIHTKEIFSLHLRKAEEVLK